jgi:hypothetical protein
MLYIQVKTFIAYLTQNTRISKHISPTLLPFFSNIYAYQSTSTLGLPFYHSFPMYCSELVYQSPFFHLFIQNHINMQESAKLCKSINSLREFAKVVSPIIEEENRALEIR